MESAAPATDHPASIRSQRRRRSSDTSGALTCVVSLLWRLWFVNIWDLTDDVAVERFVGASPSF